jgi:hypothetical protein
MSEQLHVTPNLICQCEHNLLSHEHYPPEADHCGYPGCKCDYFVGKPTPPDVIDAIKLLGAYVKEKHYASVKIGPEGGAYFELKMI